MRLKTWRALGPGLLGGALIIGTATAAAAQAPNGEALYERRCAACHDNPTERIPPRQALQNMTAARILRTLDFGSMMTVAYALRRDEREAVARFVGRPGEESGPAPGAFCSDRSVMIPEHSAHSTVIGGQVFVGSAGGVVYALRADTGCIQWTFQAAGPVRSSIVATRGDDRDVLLFGDLTGWFYALDASAGQLLWKKRPEEHESVRLSGAPVVHEGIAYVPVASWEESRSLNPEYPCCTFRGSITALRVRDGSQVWKTYMIPEEPKLTGRTTAGTATWGPSGVGIWAAPTLDLRRRLLYVTTGDNYSLPATGYSDAVMALDLESGRIMWSTQTLAGDVYNSACNPTSKGPNCPQGSGPDFDFGSAAILARTSAGRDVLLAGQKSGIVYAFDPDDKGKILWHTRVGSGGIVGGIQWGMASDSRNVYAPISDAVFTRTPTATTLDPKAGGGLTALRIDDGRRVWHVAPVPCGPAPGCSPALSAAVTVIPGVVFAGSLDGHLRAYSTSDGSVVWDVNTARSFDTVNGVKAKGGAIDGPGPLVMNGRVYVNSGYTRYGGMPGNVLLVFAP